MCVCVTICYQEVLLSWVVSWGLRIMCTVWLSCNYCCSQPVETTREETTFNGLYVVVPRVPDCTVRAMSNSQSTNEHNITQRRIVTGQWSLLKSDGGRSLFLVPGINTTIFSSNSTGEHLDTQPTRPCMG